MPYFLWVMLSLIAYIGGAIILVRVTPMLLLRSYDEGLFMGIAALAILGALLAFGAVVITYGIFSGNFGIRVLDFFFLAGIILIAIQLAFRSWRPHPMHTIMASRIIVGSYVVFLILASCYLIVLLFL